MGENSNREPRRAIRLFDNNLREPIDLNSLINNMNE